MDFRATIEQSETASRLGINNHASNIEMENAIYHIENIVVKIYAYAKSVKKTLAITSFYRCLELNRYLKSKDTSYHTLGLATDLKILGLPTEELYDWCLKNIEKFDECFLEFNKSSNPLSGWVHIASPISKKSSLFKKGKIGCS